jgi:PTS system fructose-specific IIC component
MRAIVIAIGDDYDQDCDVELAERIAQQESGVSLDLLKSLAMAREEEFGTAVGAGVAIPHARVEGLRNPAIAFGRSRHGIEWNAPDGALVQHVFFLATPMGTEDIHAQTLASIAAGMSDPANRLRVHDAPDADALFRALGTLLVRQRTPRGRKEAGERGEGPV